LAILGGNKSQPERLLPANPKGSLSNRYQNASELMRSRDEEQTTLHPFNLKTVLLAKHAQHVMLIHFPIALFIAAVGFDIITHWKRHRELADAAYYNLLVAALSTFPVIATGVLARQLQLEGKTLKGILLLHLILACASSVMIWLTWGVHFRARRRKEALPSYRVAIELVAVGLIALTAHLGGFLSGVNGPG
jgi:uncharacterized membrane protein